MSATLPLIATTPLLPPFGFLAFVLWRQLRPDLVPPWSAVPLGLLDDALSGNPLGTGILLWSIAAIGLGVSDRLFLFRTWRQDWLIASVAVFAYIVGVWLLTPINGGVLPPFSTVVLPNLMGVLALPLLLWLSTAPNLSWRRM